MKHKIEQLMLVDARKSFNNLLLHDSRSFAEKSTRYSGMTSSMIKIELYF